MPAANGGRSSASQAARLWRDDRQLVVAVAGGVAVAGEVLERGRDPGRLEARAPRPRPGRRWPSGRRRTTGNRSPRCPPAPSVSATGAKSTLMPIAASSLAGRPPGRLGEPRAGRPRRTPSRTAAWSRPSLTRVTTPYSWSVPISSGAPPGSRRGLLRPAVSSRTCSRLSTLVVGLVAPVGSSAAKPTRISPPRWNLATISAGVSTPARSRLPAADGRVHLGRCAAVGVRHQHLPGQLARRMSVATAAAARAAGSPVGAAARRRRRHRRRRTPRPGRHGVGGGASLPQEPTASRGPASTTTASTQHARHRSASGKAAHRVRAVVVPGRGLVSAHPGQQRDRGTVAGVAVRLEFGVPGGAERLLQGVRERLGAPARTP